MQVRGFNSNYTDVTPACASPMHAVVEVILDDNRTVQLVVSKDGKITLRAWGNTPMLLGNGESTSFTAILPYEQPTCDEYGNRLNDTKSSTAIN